MLKHFLGRSLAPLLTVSVLAATTGRAFSQQPPVSPMGPSIQFKVQRAVERMEMTVNTSRILTLDRPIVRAQVNNPAVVQPHPLSPNEVQLSAQGTGVTQVNLWDENQKLYTIDVIVYADTRELNMHLKMALPSASLTVRPIGQSLLISGNVDQPGDVNLIMQIAEQYSSQVINNLTLSGVHQVALQVKVVEVSRTKLRQAGFDWTQVSGANIVQSGLGTFVDTASFGLTVVDGGNSLTALMDLLRQDQLAKIHAEPTLVTSSGRPAMFQAGGEIGYQLNGGITGPTAEFKEYGTRVDFVPVVLGKGRINLQVRAMVTEIDAANSAGPVPALRTRQAETGVELQAGQTMVIAGLLQTRVETENRGLPWISEVPLLGIPFRRVEHSNNEVELLILVTPQLVDAMDAKDVPKCLPGQRTTDPSDWELIVQGHLEVPNCCPDGECSQCKQGGQGPNLNPAIVPEGGVIIEQHERVVRPEAGDSARSQSRRSTGSPTAENRQTRSQRQIVQTSSQSAGKIPKPGFIGAIGYDVVK